MKRHTVDAQVLGPWSLTASRALGRLLNYPRFSSGLVVPAAAAAGVGLTVVVGFVL